MGAQFRCRERVELARISLSPSRSTGGPMKSARERAEEKRAEKLELVREQVENGSLVIRPMTREERRRYPPRREPAARPGRR